LRVGDAYPGTESFRDSEEDRRLFFGRDAECHALLGKVLTEPLVVLFARSGMGKTSLLNAFLLPNLRERGFIPVVARLKAGEPALSVVAERFREEAARHDVSVSVREDATSLWGFFRNSNFDARRPVVIFDQFEEVFTRLREAERKLFLADFADLVRQRVPAAVRDRALAALSQESNAAMRARLIEEAYGTAIADVKVVVGVREDFIAELERMRDVVPHIFTNTVRLLPLSRDNAREAIVAPAAAQKFRYSDDALETLLGFLDRTPEDGDPGVSPFELQVLCQDIDARHREKELATIESRNFDGERGLRRVMRRHYRLQLRKISWWRRGAAARFCERGLVLRSGQRASPVAEETAIDEYGVRKQDLITLQDVRLIAAERQRNRTVYELAHDALVEPVLQAKRERTARRRIAIAIVVLVVVAIGAFLRVRHAEYEASQRRLELAIDLKNADYARKSGLIADELRHDAVNLTGLDLSGVRIAPGIACKANRLPIRCDFSGADLSGAVLNNVTFDSAAFLISKFRGASLEGSTFNYGCYLFGADFTGSHAHGVTFDESDIASLNFAGADLRNARFIGADVSDTDFSNADLDGAVFDGTAWWTAIVSDAQRSDFARRFPIGVIASSPAMARRLDDEVAIAESADAQEVRLRWNTVAFRRAVCGLQPEAALNDIANSLRDASRRDRYYATYRDTRGVILLLLHRIPEARDEFNAGCGAGDGDDITLQACRYHRGIAEQILGNNAAAQQWFARSKKYIPTYEKVLLLR